MNKQKLIEQLKIDEGYRLDVYKDSLGLNTVGVGHLVLPEDKLNFGDKITEQKCNEFLEHDINTAITGVKKVIKNFDQHPDEIQNELINLTFNLGLHGLNKFKNFLECLKNKEYVLAADELKDSLWYKQVGKRSKRIELVFRNMEKQQ